MPAENILVVVVDGLRASALGAYGNTSFPTPALDRFAAAGFLLDWCYAPTADLAEIYQALWHSVHPARPELCAGLPTPHDVSARSGDLRRTLSLPRHLAAQKYTTTLVTDEPQLTSFAAASEFDQFLQLADLSKSGDSSARAADAAHTSLARLFASASDVVTSTTPGSPRLVWVHARGMYGPWDAPLDLQRSLLDEGDPPPVDDVTPPDFLIADSDDPDAAYRYACAYAAQAMVLDTCWEAFINAVESTGADNEWLVMLLGARGFPLGEHRRVGGVDPRLYGEQLHVPWLIRYPNGLGRLARSGQLASHFDLSPTLVDCIGGPTQEGATIDGTSIRPLVTAQRPTWRDSLLATGDEGHRVIRTEEWCLRQDAAISAADSATSASLQGELYVRPDDRWETNDVAKLCPDVVETLAGTMNNSLQRMSHER